MKAYEQRLLTTIAKEELGLQTLKKRNSDNLDFRDLSVTGIKRALLRAYHTGQEGFVLNDASKLTHLRRRLNFIVSHSNTAHMHGDYLQCRASLADIREAAIQALTVITP